MSKPVGDCQTIRKFKVTGSGKSGRNAMKSGEASIYNFVLNR